MFRIKCRLQDTDLYKKKLVEELHYLHDENDKLVLSRYEINHAIEMLKKPEDIKGFPVFPPGTKSLLSKCMTKDVWDEL